MFQENPNGIDFGSARDILVSKDTLYFLSEDVGGDVELPPDSVAIKYAFRSSQLEGFVANGPIPAHLLSTLFAALKKMPPNDGFKIYRMNAKFADIAVVYTTLSGAQKIDIGDLENPDVIFGDNYEPYGVGTRNGNVSVKRAATPL